MTVSVIEGFPEKFIVAYLFKKLSGIMGPEYSLLCSQELGIRPYSEPLAYLQFSIPF